MKTWQWWTLKSVVLWYRILVSSAQEFSVCVKRKYNQSQVLGKVQKAWHNISSVFSLHAEILTPQLARRSKGLARRSNIMDYIIGCIVCLYTCIRGYVCWESEVVGRCLISLYWLIYLNSSLTGWWTHWFGKIAGLELQQYSYLCLPSNRTSD